MWLELSLMAGTWLQEGLWNQEPPLCLAFLSLTLKWTNKRKTKINTKQKSTLYPECNKNNLITLNGSGPPNTKTFTISHKPRLPNQTFLFLIFVMLMSQDSSDLCGFDNHMRQLLFSLQKQTNVNVMIILWVLSPFNTCSFLYLVTSLHSWQVKFFLTASICESSLTIIIGTDVNKKYPLNEWLNEELNFVREELRLEMAFGKATISTTEKVNDFSNNVKIFFSWFNLPSSFYIYWDKKRMV